MALPRLVPRSAIDRPALEGCEPRYDSSSPSSLKRRVHPAVDAWLSGWDEDFTAAAWPNVAGWA